MGHRTLLWLIILSSLWACKPKPTASIPKLQCESQPIDAMNDNYGLIENSRMQEGQLQLTTAQPIAGCLNLPRIDGQLTKGATSQATQFCTPDNAKCYPEKEFKHHSLPLEYYPLPLQFLGKKLQISSMPCETHQGELLCNSKQKKTLELTVSSNKCPSKFPALLTLLKEIDQLQQALFTKAKTIHKLSCDYANTAKKMKDKDALYKFAHNICQAESDYTNIFLLSRFLSLQVRLQNQLSLYAQNIDALNLAQETNWAEDPCPPYYQAKASTSYQRSYHPIQSENSTPFGVHSNSIDDEKSTSSPLKSFNSFFDKTNSNNGELLLAIGIPIMAISAGAVLKQNWKLVQALKQRFQIQDAIDKTLALAKKAPDQLQSKLIKTLQNRIDLALVKMKKLGVKGIDVENIQLTKLLDNTIDKSKIAADFKAQINGLQGDGIKVDDATKNLSIKSALNGLSTKSKLATAGAAALFGVGVILTFVGSEKLSLTSGYLENLTLLENEISQLLLKLQNHKSQFQQLNRL